ncbi:MAG: hypothetical protein ACK4OP_08220, partial [Gemmobacter sp.]
MRVPLVRLRAVWRAAAGRWSPVVPQGARWGGGVPQSHQMARSLRRVPLRALLPDGWQDVPGDAWRLRRVRGLCRPAQRVPG